MTTPDNPYGDPGQNPPPPPPTYGHPPAYGQPPAYRAEQYGAPQGQPAPYGQAPYGQAPQGNYGGTLADWGTRVVAYLIDYFVPVLPGIVVLIAGIGANSGPVVLLAILLLFLGWVYSIYNIVHQGTTGQSLGKRQMGIYLVNESNGQYVGGAVSFIRALAHILDSAACCIGFLFPLWDLKRQTFADKIMGTVVVKR